MSTQKSEEVSMSPKELVEYYESMLEYPLNYIAPYPEDNWNEVDTRKGFSGGL